MFMITKNLLSLFLILYHSIAFSITKNIISKIPITYDKNYSTKAGKPILIDILSDSYDDSGYQLLIESIDIDVNTPGIQGKFTNSAGDWVVNYENGNIIFTPKIDFGGETSIQYTIKNSNPFTQTSIPKKITVDVTPCTSEIDGNDFYIQDGETKTFSMPPADYGFQFDIYQLDNSFNLNINGIQLATNEIQFQRKDISPNAQNIRFKDGSIWEDSNVPDIWKLRGTKNFPIIRVSITPEGKVFMYGSKTSEGKLEPLELFNGNKLNDIKWNKSNDNTIIASQSVISTTLMKGHGSGLQIKPCPCIKLGNSNIPDSYSNVGISTKTHNNIKWPHNIPNGFITLNSKEKGFVITRIENINKIKDPKEGMLIYDINDKCIKLHNGSNWKCIEQKCND